MTQYLVSVYQPDGDPPPPEILEPVMRNLAALEEEMKAAGVWVFTARLHPPSTATVLTVDDRDVLMTDGPYVEGKEHLGGFTIIEVPDLDAALHLAGRANPAGRLPPLAVRPPLDGGPRPR